MCDSEMLAWLSSLFSDVDNGGHEAVMVDDEFMGWADDDEEDDEVDDRLV